MILLTGDIMQIHLSKPGGGREGPYTLEQIKKDLAAHKYRDSDYWAWHEGLTEWVPLYSLPGIATTDDSAPPVAAPPLPKQLATPAKPKASAPDSATAPASAVPARAEPQPTLPKARAAAAPAAPAAGPEPEEVAAPAESPAMFPDESAAAGPRGFGFPHATAGGRAGCGQASSLLRYAGFGPGAGLYVHDRGRAVGVAVTDGCPDV